ncbi:MAG TPA: hypothetical protein VIX12_06710 [Candidatus Binataceae bacterium]
MKSRACFLAAIWAAIFSLAAWPGVAFACPTCFAASSGAGRYGYYLSTMLLSLMPLLIAAAFGALLYFGARWKRKSAYLRSSLPG